jgi:hypothetical protein
MKLILGICKYPMDDPGKDEYKVSANKVFDQAVFLVDFWMNE